MDSLVSALTFESIPSFGSRLNEILGYCKDDLGSIMHTSILLCGLFSLLYIGNIVWQSWCNGGSINIYALFRPVVFVNDFNIIPHCYFLVDTEGIFPFVAILNAVAAVL